MKLLHKKRGDRTSVPALAGSLVEALVDAALTLVGSSILAIVVVDLLFRWLEQRELPSVWHLALFALPALLCVSVGLFRLSSLVFHSTLTVERRRRMIDRARPPRGDGSTQRPTIPELPSVTKHSGKHLAYRLPIIDDQLRPLANLGGLGLLASITTTALFAALFERSFSLVTTIALIVAGLAFASLGIWSGIWFVIRLFRWYRYGPTCIEVEEHPLLPGTQLKLHIRQCDRARWRRIHVVLECCEEAVFHQGTDVRREQRVVCELPCELVELSTTREGDYRDFQATYDLPYDLMHSFASGNNSVHWRLRVKARAKHSVQLDREAPLVVAPPREFPAFEWPRPARRAFSSAQTQA